MTTTATRHVPTDLERLARITDGAVIGVRRYRPPLGGRQYVLDTIDGRHVVIGPLRAVRDHRALEMALVRATWRLDLEFRPPPVRLSPSLRRRVSQSVIDAALAAEAEEQP